MVWHFLSPSWNKSNWCGPKEHMLHTCMVLYDAPAWSPHAQVVRANPFTNSGFIEDHSSPISLPIVGDTANAGGPFCHIASIMNVPPALSYVLEILDYIKSTIEGNEMIMSHVPLSLACVATTLCLLFPSYLFPILPASIIIGSAYGVYVAPAVMSTTALVVVLGYVGFMYWLHLVWVRREYIISIIY